MPLAISGSHYQLPQAPPLEPPAPEELLLELLPELELLALECEPPSELDPIPPWALPKMNSAAHCLPSKWWRSSAMTCPPHPEGSAEASLSADRVQQIIGNRVANSVAYGDLQQPITVTSRLGDGACEVSVHDYVSAIPDVLLAGLFEPMPHGTDQGSDVRSVGLGLHSVRKLAKVHAGDVAVSSCATLGTTFTVEFQGT